MVRTDFVFIVFREIVLLLSLDLSLKVTRRHASHQSDSEEPICVRKRASTLLQHILIHPTNPTNEDDLQKYHRCVARISVLTFLVAALALYRSSHNLFFRQRDYQGTRIRNKPFTRTRMGNPSSEKKTQKNHHFI